jgi:hypothetical protein
MADLSSSAIKHQEFLNEHDRLAKLFVTDRFAFEIERKRIIHEAIDNFGCSEKSKNRLRTQQKEWDRILKGAGSAENRFSMIQALFWHHVVNEWQPALQKYVTTLNSTQIGKNKRSTLSLVKG